jgi:hypothetical protein
MHSGSGWRTKPFGICGGCRTHREDAEPCEEQENERRDDAEYLAHNKGGGGERDYLDRLLYGKNPVQLWYGTRLSYASPRLAAPKRKRVAEGVGFEPTVPLRVRRFSRPVP